MIKVVNAAQMREMDRKAINETGIPGSTLMENAGRAVVDIILNRFDNLKRLRVNIFAGKGNNGGDGFVVARLLKNLGAEPAVFLVAEKKEVKGDAKLNMDVFIAMGGRVKEFVTTKHIHNFKLKFFHTSVVVDALLGTGTDSAPRDFYNDVIEVMNSQGKLKIAVDVPSGLSADSGVVPGSHFRADVTVTFGSPKVGLVTPPARNAVGELVVADISIPASVVAESSCEAYLLEHADITRALPKRPEDAHKGVFGHLLTACGSKGMGGAAALSSMGALRVGTGLVTASVPAGVSSAFEVGVREVMTISLKQTESGAISGESSDRFLQAAENKTAVLIGPGLGQEPSTKSFVHRVAQEFNGPLVIDADGLNLIGRDSGIVAKRSAPTILTPHPGEMARLLGVSSADVQNDRLNCAKNYARDTGAVVVLKSAGTVIATPEGEAYINPTGNHGLASGGTGDVLAGMIAGFVAQGATAVNSAIAGVYIHGHLANVYAKTCDPRSLIAGDLLDLLPAVLKEFQR